MTDEAEARETMTALAGFHVVRYGMLSNCKQCRQSTLDFYFDDQNRYHHCICANCGWNFWVGR